MNKGEDLDFRTDCGIVLSSILLAIIGLVSLYTEVKHGLQPPMTSASEADFLPVTVISLKSSD